jgi:fatty acid desaturase
MSVFKYAEDRLPVAVAVGLTCLDLGAYVLLDNLWLLLGYWLLMVVPKGILCAWNHHHQHVPTFRSAGLNRLLELSYALHTGMGTHAWLLHHVLGHHQNFLDQSRDESRWKGTDGRRLGMLRYMLEVAFTAYPRAYQVGRAHPKHQRTFLIFSGLTLLVVSTLLWLKPLAGLVLFLLPMITSLLYTAWVTYDHHAGLDTADEFHASYNIMNRWYNRLTGNLGYHTAHHHRQGVHWSRLPALHARIADRIPARLYCASSFDRVLPDPTIPHPAPQPISARATPSSVLAP